MFKHKSQIHLKPLSKYARKICDDAVAHTSVCQFLNPPNNLKKKIEKAKACCGQSAASPKESLCPLVLSPDAGCFVDSPSLTKDPVTRERKQHVGSLIENMDCPHSLTSDAQNVAISFDLDVDDMLNLSPCGHSCKSWPDCEKRCKPIVSGTSPALPPEQSPREGGRCSATPVNATKVKEDGGYFSYHSEDQPKDLSTSANQPSSQASCRQLHLDCHVLEKHQSSFLVSDLDIMSGGPYSAPATPHLVLESPTVDVGNVGFPMLQSSICHSPSVTELCEGGGESMLDSTFESHLQVKVKSVVVSAGHPQSSMPVGTTRGHNTPTLPAKRGCVSSMKGITDLGGYLASVSEHLDEASRGVMRELSNLISQVADQTSGSSPLQWQHPSDLTCRNYQTRFGGSPTLSLVDWKARSSKAGKRFAGGIKSPAN